MAAPRPDSSSHTTPTASAASRALNVSQRTPSSRALHQATASNGSISHSAGLSSSPGSDASDSASVTSHHTLRTLGAKGTESGIKLADDLEDPAVAPAHGPARSPWSNMVGLGHAPIPVSAGGTFQDPTKHMTPKEASRWRRQVLLNAAAKLGILFIVCSVGLGGLLWVSLPVIDDADRGAFKLPKSFDELKALNAVLQRYKDENFARVMLCWVIVYMFLQAFSIPGSMYMSILAGAMWGVPLALPIVCASVATGATICYLISKFLGQVLVALPSWKARVDAWKVRMDEHSDNMLSYLIVIRMMPFPPHNIVNLLAPHLGIEIPLFWISTFFGIFAVSVIHTTIGEKLDQMTSADDFNLFSVRNALLLGGVCCAVMIPVLVRRYTAAQPLEEAPVDGRAGRVRLEGEEGIRDYRGAAGGLVGRGRFDDDDEDEDELPPVSLRGALMGVGNGNGHGSAPRASNNQTKAWREERNADDDGGAYSDDAEEVASSVDGEAAALFDDRREQGASGRRGGRTATREGPRGVSGKASRILGLDQEARERGQGPAGAAVAGVQSVAGAVGALWGRVTGSSQQQGAPRLN